MPGLFSNVFANDDGRSETSQVHQIGADGEAELSPTVAIGHEVSGTYQNPDGSTTTWSSETDVVLTVDVAATVAATTGITHGGVDEG